MYQPKKGELVWFIDGSNFSTVIFQELEDETYKGIDTQYGDAVYSKNCKRFSGVHPLTNINNSSIETLLEAFKVELEQEKVICNRGQDHKINLINKALEELQ